MKSILVIDDNKDLRENTAEILELAGYKTFTAGNGKKAVEIALKENPSLIVCDIMMPGLDGYGVLHLLKKNTLTENIPFIFLTAKTERSDLRKGMEMGADDYITKPFDDIELLKAVEVRLKKTIISETEYTSSVVGINDFFNDIKNAGINDLTYKYEVQEYHKKQNLYTEGYRPKFLFYLIKGKIKSYKTNDEGKEYITDLFNTGDFIGYSALIQEMNYDDSALVLEDAEVLQLPREDFLTMINTDMSIAKKFIQIITNNVKEKEDRLITLAYGSLRKRIAKTLVDMHYKFNPENSGEPLEILREDIARYVGTATESLIRTLSDFKAEKLIEITGTKIFIKNIDELKNLLY
jgi:CheY-like chemotaxis protein/CRP-like cAMP-binding protein